jgi:predicted negative regulator of RcsB-dependent stress response
MMTTRTLISGFVFLVVAGTSLSIRAQQQTAESADATVQLQNLADQVKTALQRGDLEQANRLASDLMAGIFKQRQALEPNPQTKLAKLEREAPSTGLARFYALPGLAKAAFDAGDLNKAGQYARELLALAPSYQKDWNYGNALFFGNMIIGRVALRQDRNVDLAKQSLVVAGQTPGSPQLNSFGPNMSLAQDLLTLGEKEIVLQFFALCRNFWKLHPEKLDEWTAMVKGGVKPNFGANLKY